MPGRRRNVYLYVSSYSPERDLPGLPAAARRDLRSSRCRCKAPEKAAVVDFPVLFPDGGNPGGPPTRASPDHRLPRHHRATRRRTWPPAPAWATASCSTSPTRRSPKVIDRVQDNVNFAFWHSATFNNAATRSSSPTSWAAAARPTCNAAIGPNRGADGIYDIVGKGDQRKLVFRSYYKIPRHQADTENCVAHNGSLIPVKGRDIMVQAWYQGGVSVWDFTDSAQAQGDRATSSAARSRTDTLVARRLLVGVLLQRLHLLQRHRQGLRRPEARRPAHRTAPRRCGCGELNVQTQPDYR